MGSTAAYLSQDPAEKAAYALVVEAEARIKQVLQQEGGYARTEAGSYFLNGDELRFIGEDLPPNGQITPAMLQESFSNTEYEGQSADDLLNIAKNATEWFRNNHITRLTHRIAETPGMYLEGHVGSVYFMRKDDVAVYCTPACAYYLDGEPWPEDNNVMIRTQPTTMDGEVLEAECQEISFTVTFDLDRDLEAYLEAIRPLRPEAQPPRPAL